MNAGQLLNPDKIAVVAGNGTSLTQLKPGQVLASDTIIRVNNFFFEPKFYLGRRVDLAFMGGDPRVAPFMFETLWRCRKDYTLRAFSSHNQAVIRAGRRRFGALFEDLRYRDASLKTEITDLIAHYQRPPTTGIYALLMAHALGASQIILTGIDFHSTPQRYPFKLGPHYRALMGQDLNQRGTDTHLHNTDLDRAIIETLTRRDDVQLWRSSDITALNELMPLAPLRDGPQIVAEPRHPPTDWAARSGVYPIALLKTLRRMSALRRRLGKKPT